MSKATVAVPIPEDLARQLPVDPAERDKVLILGLREWKVRKALEAYKLGEGTLAFAARQAGVSLREIIPLAYAYGLTPKVDPADLEISEGQASHL